MDLPTALCILQIKTNTQHYTIYKLANWLYGFSSETNFNSINNKLLVKLLHYHSFKYKLTSHFIFTIFWQQTVMLEHLSPKQQIDVLTWLLHNTGNK